MYFVKKKEKNVIFCVMCACVLHVVYKKVGEQVNRCKMINIFHMHFKMESICLTDSIILSIAKRNNQV